MDPLLLFSLACGLVQAGLLLLNAWEHRRYHRSRRGADLKPGRAPAVCLFIPCRGMDVEMESNLQALFEQRYAPMELCFIVESPHDPACSVVDRLHKRHPDVPARVVFAGLATGCGQKVHNLMQGTATVTGETEVLAFADSDARPHPLWLARLVDRLQSGKHAVATGYRWYAPLEPTFANRLLSAINNTIIAVMGPHGFNLVWGGAWAIRAEAFKRLGLPQAWRGSLSDDLVASRLVHRAGLRVAYEPHCLVCSPADFTWRSLGEFLRRQYLVVRVYAPRWWCFAAASNAFTNLIAWGLPALAVWLAWTGGPWIIPACGGAAYYLLMASRARWAAEAVRPFVAAADDEYRAIARINIWAWPLVTLVIGLGLAASAWRRTLVWRGISYQLDSSSQTTILKRPTTSMARIPDDNSNPCARAA